MCLARVAADLVPLDVESGAFRLLFEIKIPVAEASGEGGFPALS
jgi:hypothetical protein